MMFKTPIRLQTNKVDCGPTCLGIILEYYGQIHSNYELIQYCGISKNGANITQIKEAAQALKFISSIKKMGLNSLSKLDRPQIIHWKMQHYVVFEGMNNKVVWINDPAIGRRTLSIEEFQQGYTGICLTIKPAKMIQKCDKKSMNRIFFLLPKNFSILYANMFAVLTASFILLFTEILFGGAIKVFFDYVVENKMTSWGYFITITTPFLIAFRFWVRIAHKAKIESFAREVVGYSKQKFLKVIDEIVLPKVDHQYLEELYSRTIDIEKSIYFLTSALFYFVLDSIVFVIAFMLIWLMSPILAILQIVPLLILLFWSQVILSRTRELSIVAREQAVRYENLNDQRTNSFSRFYAMGMLRHLVISCLPSLGKRQAANASLFSHLLKLTAVRNSIYFLSFPLTTYVGAYFLIDGQFTYGDFMFASIISIMWSSRIDKLYETIVEFRSIKPIIFRALDSIDEIKNNTSFLNSPSSKQEIADITFKEDVVYDVKGLEFGYNKDKANLIKDLTFQVFKGEVVYLHAPSGSGKSAILELMVGLRKPNKGTIKFNGNRLNYFAKVGYVFSDDSFISGPLQSFIAGSEHIEITRMYEVIDIVGLKERLSFFIECPNLKPIEQQGLSKGECQRLLLAKALYYNNKCIVFDRAFEHISLKESRKIIEKLRMLGTTVILATQRSEIQVLCDRRISIV